MPPPGGRITALQFVRLKCDAAAVVVLKVEMAITATDIGPPVLFLPGETGGGAADAHRGVRADDPGALAGF